MMAALGAGGNTGLTETPALLAINAKTWTTTYATITCKIWKKERPFLGNSVKINEKAEEGQSAGYLQSSVNCAPNC